MTDQLPPLVQSPGPPQHIKTRVLRHDEVAPRHFRLKLAAPTIAAAARAGQFVHLLPRRDSSFDPLLRRAFSILAADEEGIGILYRVEGRGTALLSRFAPGDEVDLIGPLGQPFAPLPQRALLVGGGVGVPPLAMLAAQKIGGIEHDLVALIGARTSSDVICLEDFAAQGVEVQVATDDGSMGHHGRVTDLLQPHLSSCASHNGPATQVYACGPFAMLRAVAAMCARHEVKCQVSLEENMPCGVGVCNGCVVPMLGAGDDYGRYRRICVEGPVLWADEVAWPTLDGH